MIPSLTGNTSTYTAKQNNLLVSWLPEVLPWPLPWLLQRLGRRTTLPGIRLIVSLDEPRALGALSIHSEDGNVLLRLADQLPTRHKVFRLPPLPEGENLTLRDAAGNILWERLVHLKQEASEVADAEGNQNTTAVVGTDIPVGHAPPTADAESTLSASIVTNTESVQGSIAVDDAESTSDE